MGDISRVNLFGKLDALAYKAIEGATVFCKMRGNPYVELAHWLNQILQQQNSDLHCIVRAFDLDSGRLARDLTEALDRLPRGASSISDFSVHVIDAVERVVNHYLTLRKKGERFLDTYRRVGMEPFKTAAYQEQLNAAHHR